MDERFVGAGIFYEAFVCAKEAGFRSDQVSTLIEAKPRLDARWVCRRRPQCIVGTQISDILDITRTRLRDHATSLSHQKDFARDFHFLTIETDANSL